jgi:CheY-like chemotaxis protein
MALGLASCGLDAATAADAREALARLRAERFDWLVCDVRMPGEDGIQLATRARAMDARIGLIVMSASDLTEQERQCVAALGATLMAKPVNAASVARHCAGDAPWPRTTV